MAVQQDQISNLIAQSVSETDRLIKVVDKMREDLSNQLYRHSQTLETYGKEIALLIAANSRMEKSLESNATRIEKALEEVFRGPGSLESRLNNFARDLLDMQRRVTQELEELEEAARDYKSKITQTMEGLQDKISKISTAEITGKWDYKTKIAVAGLVFLGSLLTALITVFFKG